MMTVLAIVAVLACCSLGILLLAHGTVHRTLARRRPPGGPTPPVSILKPLKGLDDGLYENLAALALQDYPDFEILLGAEDRDDPALAVARRVQEAFPAVRIRLVPCDRPIGLNPKVNNLSALAAVAANDLILVSDSNVRPDPGYLRAMVSEMADSQVGMVSSLLAGTGEGTLGALMENAHLNSFVAGSVCAAAVLAGRACVVGKSMLFRKSHLQQVGGWWSVRDILAEDYVLGERFQRAGFRVVLSPHVLHTVNRTWPVSRFWNRHVRWGQLRRWISPPAFLAEWLGNPIFWLASLLVVSRMESLELDGGRDLLGALAVSGCFLKWLSDEVLAIRLRGRGHGPTGVLAIPLKDLLLPAIWVAAALQRTVDWRGNRLRIGPGSRLSRPRVEVPVFPAPDGQSA